MHHLRLLLKSRAAPDAAAGSTGATPVLVAAEAGHVDVLKALLQGPVDMRTLPPGRVRITHLAGHGQGLGWVF